MSDKLTAERLRALEKRLREYHKLAAACGNLTDNPRNLARMAGEAADAILAMAEERDRMREDAARYHWLRDHSCPPHNFYISVPDEFAGERYGPSEVDAYIDEARRALGKDQA